MTACVVVNWNGWRDTIACLRTLSLQETTEDLRVYVVDNGSTNDSVEQIERFLALNGNKTEAFRLLKHGQNVGFPSGANIGIRYALANSAEFVWLLNNDTECPPDTLQKLVTVARAQPHAGIIGTVLYEHQNPLKVQAWSGGHSNRWLGTSTHAHSPFPQTRGAYTTFASALIRAEVFRDIGLLYEGFFMYYDDADFCLRMEKTSWKIAVATDTAVLHKEGASGEGPRNPFMEKTITVSGLRHLKRNSPLPFVSQVAFVALKVANRGLHREWAAVQAVLLGAAEYLSQPLPSQ